VVTLITGGIKSGKTSFGLSLGKPYRKKVYLATAEAFDEEMKKKIENHQKERKDEWLTIEEPLELHKALLSIKDYEFLMIDCITLWINNLMYYKNNYEDYLMIFLEVLHSVKDKRIVIISNEVGMGVVPGDATSRRYINCLGLANQRIVDCYRHTYQKKVNKGEVVMKEEETKSKSLSDLISVVISERGGIRIVAASIIFDLFKKFGIYFDSKPKLLPTWRQL
jgi:adenosylcobinamide kinase/adenosylcobinamide-phosphate guanylyltransferase